MRNLITAAQRGAILTPLELHWWFWGRSTWNWSWTFLTIFAVWCKGFYRPLELPHPTFFATKTLGISVRNHVRRCKRLYARRSRPKQRRAPAFLTFVLSQSGDFFAVDVSGIIEPMPPLFGPSLSDRLIELLKRWNCRSEHGNFTLCFCLVTVNSAQKMLVGLPKRMNVFEVIFRVRY